MIRAGLSAYGAAKLLREDAMPDVHPIFCAQRFGQSITFLPDGRIIQIGGEHEDYYDPDFCIYNDVFVHSPEGTIDIFNYPEDDFPPTDFHTATLVDDFVYVVGSLGYQGRRQFGETPVFRLNTRTLRIERIATRGDAPGWIFEHRAEATGEDTIRISGGKIAVGGKNGEEHLENDRSFILDLNTFTWSAVLQRQP